MNAIDPKMKVSEILKMYPETQSVFHSFNMKCAENNSDYADKTLEENIYEERVNFMDVFSRLDKIIHKPVTDTLSKLSGSMNRNPLADRRLNRLKANEEAFLKAVNYESSGNENFTQAGPQTGANMPELHTVNGIGKMFFGKFDRTGIDRKTYRTILFFSFLYFPIYPLGCYRVRFTGKWSEKSWIIYGEEKRLFVECIMAYLTGIFKNLALIILVFAVCIFIALILSVLHLF